MNTPANDAIAAKTHEIVQDAGQAVDSALEQACETLDKAESRLRRLRDNVDPVVDKLTSKAQKIAEQSRCLASETKARTGESLKRAADVTTRYVSDQPMRSVLIAAGVGAAVALLVAALASRQRSRHAPKTRY